MDTVHLLLFSRAPVEGETKTRLAAAIGARAARDFHVHCLNDTLETCLSFARAWEGAGRERPDPAGAGVAEGGGARRGGPVPLETPAPREGPAPRVMCHLFFAPLAPPGPEAAFGAAGVAIPPAFRLHPQIGPDLGARMAGAFAEVLGDGTPPVRALLIGSDLPLLEEAHLRAAAEALGRADAVFGPAGDGGYYLVGLRAPCPELFALPRWGGADVLAETLARAEAAGLTVARLDPLPDVDTGADLARVRAHPRFAGLAGRRACRFIAGLDTAQ